mgnify:CR=1 FL=1
MNKSFLFVIMMVAASFTGCIDSEDSEDTLTDPVGEVNVPGNALVFTRDADATECSNGGITLDVGVDDDGDGKLNATEIFNTSTICNGADGVAGERGEPGEKGEMGDQGDPGEDVTRSNDTLLTRIDDPDASLNCVAGGRVISYGLDNGDGGGISANGNLESGEIDTSTTLCSTMSFGLFRDINLGSGSSLPTEFTALNDDQIIFTADNGELGRELWLLRPDAGSVVMVKDINFGIDGSNPGYLTEMNGELYFMADDGEHGRELWKTNGTEEGTIMVKDIWNGINGGGPSGFTLMNGELFFSATDSHSIHGNELWKTDGTEEGTTMVKDIRDGSDSSSPGEFTELNGELYFRACDAAHDCELWKTDGTSIGTILVADIAEDYGSYPTYLTEMNGELYFRAQGVTGTELWKTDGTGAVLVKDINEGEGSSSISNLIKMNGELYFAADDGVHGREVWKTNGTEEGTSMVVDLYPGSAMSTYFEQAVVHTDIYGNEKIYFIADSGSFGYELHVTDGTERGTDLVKDFSYGSSDGVKDYHCDYVDFCAPLTMLSLGKYLIFSANDGYFGIELYYNNVVETSVFYS